MNDNLITDSLDEIINNINKININNDEPLKDNLNLINNDKPKKDNLNLINNDKPKNKSNKELRKKLTSYWAVELDMNIFLHPEIESRLKLNTNLIPLKKIHSTLLYVGKKINDLEKVFIEFENIECTLTIDRIGISSNAMALGVKSIVYKNENTNTECDLPTFAEKQHITLALADGIPAKDSVLTLYDKTDNIDTIVIPKNDDNQGNTSSKITYIEPQIIIQGKVKKYLF